MLRFITDAPTFVVRSIMSLAHGWAEDAPDNAPEWATMVVHVGENDAPAVLSALREWRVEGRAPARQAIGDPTFAMAAAHIDRETGGSTPAPAYVSR